MMRDPGVAEAQADMRSGYMLGAPGVAASAIAWLAAAAVALSVSDSAAVWTLLAAGTLIYPASLVITKVLGGKGAHTAGNPLAPLAIEGTVWLFAGICIAFAIAALRVQWFFPAMLLVIGSRYLTFQTLYGLRVYWALGAALCAIGIGVGVSGAGVAVGAVAGGVIEGVFAGVLLRQARRATSTLVMTLLVPALSAAPVSAQATADSASGFAIVPTDAFSVHRTTNRRQFDVGFGIRMTGDTTARAEAGGFVCEAGFKHAPQNASLTREQINALVDDPDWRNLVRANLKIVFEIVTEELFTLQGYRGVEATVRPKGGAGGDLQLFMSMVETAKGRTTMLCNSTATGMPTSLATFRRIREAIRLPE